jgi:tripartite ATP-independent transporter DctM subunit
MEWASVVILIITFTLLMSAGVPIAFCIGLSTVATMLVMIPPDAAMTTTAQRLAAGLDSFTLMAIPFFILAGHLMNHGGIARRLIDFARAMLGALPGGLALVNIMAAMLMGAISGSAVAAASAIGSVLGPRMEKEGYDRNFSAAVNIAAAPAGLIIPPSNILIVYSMMAPGVPVAGLFLAGYLPGILFGAMLMLVTAITAWWRRYPSAGWVGLQPALWLFLQALPALGMIIVVIGGIILGIFTATEAAAIAVVYALALALIYREVSILDLPKILRESAVMTSIVMLLIGASTAMSWILALENIPQNVTAALLGVSSNPIVILLIINLILLAVGTFMDMTPAVLIFTPVFLPVAIAMGMHPMHFGIMMTANLCIGLCTPPVGSVLFVGCSVASVSVTRVIRPLLPMFIAQLVTLMIIAYIPRLSLWLPGLMGYL